MKLRIFVIGLIMALCAAVPAAADTTEIGQIKTLEGDVYIFRGGERLVASAGDLLHQADVLETGSNGSVGITFIDSSRFSAGPDTRLELTQFRFNPTTQDGNFTMDMKRGTVSVVSGQIAKQAPDAMKIVTPTTILGFRGTRVAVKVTE
jgi:hypothetical protein